MNSKPQFNTIAELDLTAIKMKLMHKESGEGWSQAKADAAEFEYRRFLTLMKMFPHEHVSPLFEVDIFWHYHILDTMKYAADCDRIFGYFLHHFPYSGLLGEEDEVHRDQSGERMQALYETTFGEAYIRQEHAVLSWLPETAQNAWSNPTVGIPLAMQGGAKTAWSNPTIDATGAERPAGAKTAWSNPTISATARTAWSNPTISSTARTAWSNPTISSTARTAWSNPTIDASAPRHGVTARTAWSNPTVGASQTSPAAKAITLAPRAVSSNANAMTQTA